MQMTPARDWPCQASRMVIVNLQPTVKDGEASLVIRARTDEVMTKLAVALGGPLVVRPFKRAEAFVVKHVAAPSGGLVLEVVDPVGAPLGFVLSVQVWH